MLERCSKVWLQKRDIGKEQVWFLYFTLEVKLPLHGRLPYEAGEVRVELTVIIHDPTAHIPNQTNETGK